MYTGRERVTMPSEEWMLLFPHIREIHTLIYDVNPFRPDAFTPEESSESMRAIIALIGISKTNFLSTISDERTWATLMFSALRGAMEERILKGDY